ncbi:uncharacterized protein BXIN_1603 [Babesia sp. Xinjiang]|uniref:uncharacterized protein n=1 Tax=Babesia sp. Xinjiang TaxID=462227 RepID=UPI000A242B9B|nr:uncharacterized protein BXIN_1603 [Babesia sp. Xinjiang]ORM39883.1 hypothetical protein BXIN_1603 [Babesia sp. Xinjiang]
MSQVPSLFRFPFQVDTPGHVESLSAGGEEQVESAGEGVGVWITGRGDLSQYLPEGTFLAVVTFVFEQSGPADHAHLLVLSIQEPVEKEEQARGVGRDKQERL